MSKIVWPDFVVCCHICTATMGDLFGDADDISSDEEKKGGDETEKGEQSEVHTVIAILLLMCTH